MNNISEEGISLQGPSDLIVVGFTGSISAGCTYSAKLVATESRKLSRCKYKHYSSDTTLKRRKINAK